MQAELLHSTEGWEIGHLKTALWQELIPHQSYQNTLHFLHTHIDIFDHSSVEHACGHMSTTTVLLQVVETLEDDTFPAGETITDIRQRVTRGTAVHGGAPLIGADLPCVVFTHWETTTHGMRWSPRDGWSRRGNSPGLRHRATAGGPTPLWTSPGQLAPRHAHA
jgi:hypothetical protein